MRADFSAIMPLMDWEHASDVANDLKEILKRINMPHVDLKRVIAFRSYGSSSRARARIWSFPKIWQQALNLPAHYVLEVLSEQEKAWCKACSKKVPYLVRCPVCETVLSKNPEFICWVCGEEVDVHKKD